MSSTVTLKHGMKWPKDNKPGPAFVKKILPWVEMFWHNHKRYPTDAELADRFGFDAEQLQVLRYSKFYNDCLKQRGISQVQEYFTPEQVATIAMVTNFADPRSLDVKLAAIGVTAEQYNGWMANPAFKRELAARADDIMENIYPEAQAQLAKKIRNGHFQALKFYFEVTGRANSPETVNLKLTMQRLVEAVEKHVKDPAILAAIASELQAVAPVIEAPKGLPVASSNPAFEKNNSVTQNYREHLASQTTQS